MAETNTLTVPSIATTRFLEPSYGIGTVSLAGGAIEAVDPDYTVRAQAALFTEAGAGTYTWEPVLPAGSILVDIGVQAVAAWDAATSAALNVGVKAPGDEDGYFAAVDLKATDLTIGQSISFQKGGGKEGALITGTNTHVNDRYLATAKTLSFVATSVGAGTAGRTVGYVVYYVPSLTAATFVAA